ncbi:MAG: membrane protein insertion efficiency factor YidD [Gammaproteobacteria bacterium]|nr:membrane protein insertion efficiency factor YidD [Gammaproteobacteria bacterium]
MRHLLLLAIRGYQLTLSFFLGRQCRYYPSCSHYAYEAIENHGARKGAFLSAKRLLKCHPFCEGGYDPVPESEEVLQ